MASAALKIDPKRNVTSEPEIQPVTETLNENEIAALAYQLWQERGSPIGTDQEDWFKAETELKGRIASGKSVVATDAQ